MESVRAYRFRLYPDAKRQREIDEQLELARFLYNKLLGLMNRENVMENFAVLSDGKKIGKPNFAAIREKRIARWQRVVARRQKGSRRREKAREKLHDSWEKVNRQSDDFARKTANDLISSGYTSFAVEGLHIRNMLKNHRLAGAINRAAWNGFIRVLTYKAEDATAL
jgi:putative transposase